MRKSKKQASDKVARQMEAAWWAVQDSLPNDLENPNKTGEMEVSASVYAGLHFRCNLT